MSQPESLCNTEESNIVASTEDDLPPPIGNYTFLRCIERALDHDTFVAQKNVSGELVVIRVYALKHLQRDEECRNMLERQFLVSRRVHHRHLVQYFPPFASVADFFMVESFYGGGQLFEAIEAYTHSARAGASVASQAGGSSPSATSAVAAPNFPIAFVKQVMHELMQVLHYLHESCGLVHRNVTLESIFLDDDNHVHLGKLGLCAVLPSDAATAWALREPQSGHHEGAGRVPLLELCCGAKHYVAPEVVDGSPYDGKAVDVWAAGVVLFALLTGCFPFNADEGDDDDAVLYDRIRCGEATLSHNASFASIQDPQAQNLLRSMLQVNPVARYSVAEVLEHPFLQLSS